MHKSLMIAVQSLDIWMDLQHYVVRQKGPNAPTLTLTQKKCGLKVSFWGLSFYRISLRTMWTEFRMFIIVVDKVSFDEVLRTNFDDLLNIDNTYLQDRVK